MNLIFKARVLLIIICFFSLIPIGLKGNEQETPPLSLKLFSETTPLSQATSFWVALDVHLKEGWHAYWKNPGSSGMPLQMDWELPEGWEITDVEWPTPKKFGSEELFGLGYDEDFILLVQITPKKQPLKEESALSLTARWVVCSGDACVPGASFATLSLTNAPSNSPAFFSKAWEKIPVKEASLTIEKKEDQLILKLNHPKNPKALLTNLQFFPKDPQENGQIKAKITYEGQTDSGQLVFSFKDSQPLNTLNGVFSFDEVLEKTAQLRAFDIVSPVLDNDPHSLIAMAEIGEIKSAQEGIAPFASQFFLALGFAFLGGVLLNLMPCVLPVLSLKVLGFVQMAKESRKTSFFHAFFFSLGVLLSFWTLAAVLLLLQSSGSAVGWGFQLQQPLFVSLLILFLFAFALSLFGVFELGASLTSKAGQLQAKTGAQNSFSGSFLNGILACAVATPCTGPFLGSAVGFAVTLSPFYALLIFTSLGLGMASPYLLLGAFPNWFRFLPKPGPWMITLKEITGLCMVATCLWLLWVFSAQTSSLALILQLIALFFTAIGCWVLGKWGSPIKKQSQRRWGLLFAVLFIGLSCAVSLSASRLAKEESKEMELSSLEGWEVFSPEKLASLRKAGTPVFIDFTSKWCLICQANHIVLSLPSVSEKMERLGIVKMKADWTSADPVITEELKKHGRNSVPLYLLYKKGKQQDPLILPQLLNPETLLQTLNDV